MSIRRNSAAARPSQSVSADICQFPCGTKFTNAVGTTEDGRGRSMIKMWEETTGELLPDKCPICDTPFKTVANTRKKNYDHYVGAHVVPSNLMSLRNGTYPKDRIYIIPMCETCNNQFGIELPPSKNDVTAVRLNGCSQTQPSQKATASKSSRYGKDDYDWS